ncbi:hypothetical protein [Nocardia gipuzkoensis]|uniref:hypothetical protein n=1 Tax=Nocardia gipuzkoensis TaxID=2749991 RepID=UPI0015EF3567|nr:hypothetical protein [Nocardia gipuzkoensis]
MVNYLGTASRIGWAEVPRPVRVGIERMLGDVVCAAVDQRGGFSHGVAVRVRTVGGDAAFVKAIEVGDGLAPVYRQEARIASLLPATAPAPRSRFSGEIAGWFVAGFDDVEGACPRLDEPGELRDTLELVTRLARELTPSPSADVPTVTEAYGPELVGWRTFASEGPPADLDGWPARHVTELAELEARWTAAAAVTRDVDPAAVDAFVCALAGYWAVACRKPGPPRSPRLRRHQSAFARVAIGWLACRLGWQ